MKPLLPLFVVAILGIFPARAQIGPSQDQTTGEIAGQVRDESGNPLAGATIQVEQNGWELSQGKTSPLGRYQVTVPADGVC